MRENRRVPPTSLEDPGPTGATPPRAGRATRQGEPDAALAAAVDLARAAAEEDAEPGTVGEHLGVTAEGDRLVTHAFATWESDAPCASATSRSLPSNGPARSRFSGRKSGFIRRTDPDGGLAASYRPDSRRVTTGGTDRSEVIGEAAGQLVAGSTADDYRKRLGVVSTVSALLEAGLRRQFD